ncbi:TPA: hypothetical protein DEP90_02420 [Patescibacteria group bacterium]|nr:hypothetical protein [Patescibacteria group bacterium]
MEIDQFKNRHNTQSENITKISFLKRISRKKWFKILKPIIPILLLIFTISILTWIGVFKIKSIENDTELEYIINLKETTNQYLGQSYFLLDLEQLKQDIVDSDGYVKDVTAQKIFPNKILITVEEYKPKYYLEYKEICYIFSREGLILENISEYELCDLENGIKLLSNQSIIADGKLIFDTEISQVVQILNEFGWNVAIIEVDEDILKIFDDGKEIIIESANDFDIQLAKLYLILERVNMEGMDYKFLDMRFERPVMELL